MFPNILFLIAEIHVIQLLKCRNNIQFESKSYFSCALSELKENTKKIILSFLI